MLNTERKEYKPFLQLHLVEHCNLNCKGCAHFSPVAQRKEIELDELIIAYQKIQPFFYDSFCRIELMGGEPLLHSKIESALRITRQYLKDAEIRLVTNGIRLLDMPSAFFETCLENNIIICISIYPIKLDYGKLEERLDMYGIKHKRYGDYEQCKTFICYKLNQKGGNNIVENYRKCKYAGHCIQLKDMKLYPCFISAYSTHLNDYFNLDFKCVEGDYLELNEAVSHERIDELVRNPIPFCEYCDMQNRTVHEWDISKKSITEWTNEQ